MTLKETIRNWQPGPLQIIILFTLLQVLIALLTNGFALTFDEAMWHYIGRNWFRHGLVPYSGGVDNKSPLIFAVFGLSDKLFGVNYWFPKLLGILCQSVGIYYVYKIAKHVAGQPAGILAISFYGLSLLWHSTGSKYVSYTETYEVMFIILSFYCYVSGQNKKDYFISGVFAAIGFGFRLSAFFGIATLFIASFNKNKACTLMFCAGVLSGIVSLGLIGFIAGTNFHNLYIYALVDNFGQGSATDHSLMWRIGNFSDKFLYSGLILFYPLTLVYLILKRKVDLFVLWLILEFIGINIIGIYDRVHLKELLPAFSLMSAFSVSYLINSYNISFKPVLLVVWIIFFPNLWEPLSNLRKLLWGKTEKPEQYCVQPYIKPEEGDRKKLGLWIKSNTSMQEKVYVAGFGAQEQVYSERLSPSIYFNVTQTPIAKKKLFEDLRMNKPAMILIPLYSEYEQFVGQDIRLFISGLLAKDYYLDQCLYNYNIYKIRR